MVNSDSFIERFDRWYFSGYEMSAEAWGLARVAFSIYVLLVFGLPELAYLAKIPDVFYLPPRISSSLFFSGFPESGLLTGISVLMVLLGSGMLFGYKTRFCSIAFSLVVFFGKGFVYSTGQINHDFMVWLVPIAGAFAGWGGAYSIDANRSSDSKKVSAESWPLTLLVVAFAFALCVSGIQKYLGGWALFETQAVEQWFVRNHYYMERQYFLGPLMIDFHQAWFWEMLDIATLVFEIGIIATVFFPRVYRAFIIVTVFFHLSNLLLLNIDFSFNMAFYLLFLPWENIHDKLALKKRVASVFQLRCLGGFILLFGVFFLVTEKSPLVFFMNIVGIDYLGNAMLRTVIAALVCCWAIWQYGVGKKSKVSVNKTTIDSSKNMKANTQEPIMNS